MSASGTGGFTLQIAQRFRAPPEVLFRAWTEPEQLKRWWGPGGFTVPECAIDLRPGGRYRIVMQPPDRAAHVLSGTYIAVEPPTRLVYTWSFDGTQADDGAESLVTVEFRAVGDETEVTVLQERLPNQPSRDMHRDGWKGSLDRLRALVEPPAG